MKWPPFAVLHPAVAPLEREKAKPQAYTRWLQKQQQPSVLSYSNFLFFLSLEINRTNGLTHPSCPTISPLPAALHDAAHFLQATAVRPDALRFANRDRFWKSSHRPVPNADHQALSDDVSTADGSGEHYS